MLKKELTCLSILLTLSFATSAHTSDLSGSDDEKVTSARSKKANTPLKREGKRPTSPWVTDGDVQVADPLEKLGPLKTDRYGRPHYGKPMDELEAPAKDERVVNNNEDMVVIKFEHTKSIAKKGKKAQDDQ